MTIDEAMENMRRMSTSEMQPEGAQVADWYRDVGPSPTDLLYLVAYLLHEVNARAALPQGR